MKKNIAIEVNNMDKDFVIYGDKANTLKEKMIRIGNSKREVRKVLKNIKYFASSFKTIIFNVFFNRSTK